MADINPTSPITLNANELSILIKRQRSSDKTKNIRSNYVLSIGDTTTMIYHASSNHWTAGIAV